MLPPPQPVIAFKNILQPSNAPSVQSASRVHTICDLIYERTPTSDLSSARSVEKPLHVNTTANDTRDCTVARKNSSAEANLGLEDSGAAGDDLRELMPWGDISDLKLEESVSNHCLTKKQPKEKGTGYWSNSKTNTQ